MATQTHEIALSLYTQSSTKKYRLVSSAASLTLYFEVFEKFKDVAAFGGGDILSIAFSTSEEVQRYLDMLSADDRTLSIEELK